MVIATVLLYFTLGAIPGAVKSKKITKKQVIASLIAVGIAAALWLGYLYSLAIMAYFDSHPWVVTLIGIIATATITFIVARFRGKNK